LSIILMGKRSSTAVGAAISAAAKKAKTADTDARAVGNWVQTKFVERNCKAPRKSAS
jgi:hypothetical protein